MNQNPTGVKDRNIAFAILFSILTFGIYSLYWLYKLHDDANALSGRTDELHPALVVVLCIVTFGIFQIYWAYTQGEKFQEEARARGSNDADECPVLYLVLQVANYFVFVGVTGIVNMALMQDRINKILRRNGWGRFPYGESRFTYVPEQEIAKEYEEKFTSSQ